MRSTALSRRRVTAAVRQPSLHVEDMHILSLHALFPACATLGPVFLMIGILSLNRQEPYGSSLVVTGGLMISAALHILFRMLTHKTISVDRRSVN